MASCSMCGVSIPDDQGSSTCSMCYGDPGHGKDGYYEEMLERESEAQSERQAEEEQWQEMQE